MCGIAGIAGPGVEAIYKKAMPPMMKAIAHRGPDAEGVWADKGVALGHRRLSILDLSDAGKQPMADSSGTLQLVFNGEIYNFQAIKAQLSGVTFRSGTDTEVMLEGYRKWGLELLDQMNGMFAFALWDAEAKKLVLARDRLGIKPLYYAFDGQQLIFASQIRSILASGLVKAKLNKAVLEDYLVYQTVHEPETLVKGIKMLPAGHVAVYEKGKLSIESWWEIDKPQNAPFREGEISEESTRKAVKETLTKAVERRLIADVPLGAFLSGGIDSSAMVGLMASVSEKPVETFSVVFEEKEFDESPWSSLIAKKFNTRHHPLLLKPSDFLEGLPDGLAAMDHPSVDGINSFIVSRETRAKGIKVAISGLGGDELFAGYPVFTQIPFMQAKKMFFALPLSIRKVLASLIQAGAGRSGQKIAEVLRLNNLSLEEIYPIFRTVYSPQLLDKMLGKDRPGYNAVKGFVKEHTNNMAQFPGLSRISIAEISTYTRNVLLRDTDQMSMAHALEVRVPFFDHEVVELCLRLPDSLKFPHFPKKLLVDSLGDLLPHDLVHRKKMGFVFPWQQWLKNELFSFAKTRIDRLEERNLFQMGRPSKIWEQFQTGQGGILWVHIWSLVVLEDWITRNEIETD